MASTAFAADARPLDGVRVAVLVAQDFEDSELASPVEALREVGAEVVLVAEDPGVEYTGKNGEVTVTSDVAAADVTPNEFDGLVIPGGKAPAELRTDPHMTGLARKMVLSGKPVAAICHGPQVLITARVLDDRKATCYSCAAQAPAIATARSLWTATSSHRGTRMTCRSSTPRSSGPCASDALAHAQPA
jgi:protease I